VNETFEHKKAPTKMLGLSKRVSFLE